MRRLGALALAAAILLGSATPATADLASDLSDVRQRIEALRGQAGEGRSARSAAANALFDAAAELDVLSAALAEAEEQLTRTAAEISDAEGEIEVLQGRITLREARVAELQATQAELRDAARRRAVEAYMAAASEEARLPALPEDLAEARVSLAYVFRIQEAADAVLLDYEAAKRDEQREADLLVRERESLESILALLAQRRAELAFHHEEVALRAEETRARVAAQRALLDRIERDIASIEGEITALAREESRIRDVIAREQETAGSAPGTLFRPVPGSVTSGFGYRIHPIFGDRRLHTGWDMTAGCGTPIKAANSGRVFLSGWYGGYGNTVMIDHGGGMATLYAHQSSLGASYGQQVQAGQVIGWVGTTGVSTGCHLHFEVRMSGTPVDPTPHM